MEIINKTVKDHEENIKKTIEKEINENLKKSLEKLIDEMYSQITSLKNQEFFIKDFETPCISDEDYKEYMENKLIIDKQNKNNILFYTHHYIEITRTSCDKCNEIYNNYIIINRDGTINFINNFRDGNNKLNTYFKQINLNYEVPLCFILMIKQINNIIKCTISNKLKKSDVIPLEDNDRERFNGVIFKDYKINNYQKEDNNHIEGVHRLPKYEGNISSGSDELYNNLRFYERLINLLLIPLIKILKYYKYTIQEPLVLKKIQEENEENKRMKYIEDYENKIKDYENEYEIKISSLNDEINKYKSQKKELLLKILELEKKNQKLNKEFISKNKDYELLKELYDLEINK